jgi:hypothetical protein
VCGRGSSRLSLLFPSRRLRKTPAGCTYSKQEMDSDFLDELLVEAFGYLLPSRPWLAHTSSIPYLCHPTSFELASSGPLHVSNRLKARLITLIKSIAINLELQALAETFPSCNLVCCQGGHRSLGNDSSTQTLVSSPLCFLTLVLYLYTSVAVKQVNWEKYRARPPARKAPLRSSRRPDAILV